MPGKPGPVAQRFWAKVRKGEGCWEWQGGIGKHWYGQFDFRFACRAHRAAWILTYGNIPNDLQVLHRCDNKRCVRPSHLFLGTQKDNVVDCVNKGRISRGELRPQHKLKTEDIRKIRKLREQGLIYREIAERFGIHFSYVCAIVQRRAWRHVDAKV